MLELCEQEEVDRLLAGVKMTVEDYHLRYETHLSEMNIYFEDVGIRSKRQLTQLGKILRDLGEVKYMGQ